MVAALSFRAWFPLSPGVVLGVLIGLSGLAALLDRASRRRRKKALRELAARSRMTYSARDQLRVADKVMGRLPAPGAADLYVTDVIYGSQGESYRYWFTAEYTIGAVRPKRRQVRVGTLAEPRGNKASDGSPQVSFAPEDLPLIEQYIHLGLAPSGDQTP